MTRSAVIVLGAGFSKPAGGPLLREMMNPSYIRRSRGSHAILEHLSRQIGADMTGSIETANVEALFTMVWQEARTAGQIEVGGRKISASDVLSELLIHLGSLAEQVSLKMNSHLGRLYRGYFEDWSERFDELSLITFNYDTLVEQVLDASGMIFDEGGNVDFAFVDSSRQRDLNRRGSEVTLLKLHGSVSWGICRGCRKAEVGDDVVAILETPYVGSRRKSCPFCDDRYLDPGIIPPISGKAGELHYMEPIWKDARDALRNCSRLEIVGYSLPGTDVEAASLLREASHLSVGGAVTTVCGESGASAGLRDLLPSLVDTRARFEDFLEVNFTR